MDALPKVGRYLYAIPMAIFGLLHFMNGSMMAGMVPIPGGVIWVYVVGAALIAAAVAILTGKQAVLAARLLGLMLLIFALSIHLPIVMGGGDAMAGGMTMMLKDTALAGAAFILSGVLGAEAEAGTGTEA